MPFFLSLVIGVTLALGVVGCKKSPKGPTYIPGAPTKAPGTDPGFGATSPNPGGGLVGRLSILELGVRFLLGMVGPLAYR